MQCIYVLLSKFRIWIQFSYKVQYKFEIWNFENVL